MAQTIYDALWWLISNEYLTAMLCVVNIAVGGWAAALLVLRVGQAFLKQEAIGSAIENREKHDALTTVPGAAGRPVGDNPHDVGYGV